MRAADAVITALDFESTGAVGSYPDEPWQVGMVVLRAGRVDPFQCFEMLFRVGDRPFHPLAPADPVRRASARHAEHTLAEAWPGMAPWLRDRPLAAHNAATERKFLRGMAPLHPLGPWMDTLRLTRRAYPDLASYALEDVLAALGLTGRVGDLCPGRGAHDALYDAMGCAVLLEHLLRLPGWRACSVQTLVRVRTRSHARRARGSGGAIRGVPG